MLELPAFTRPIELPGLVAAAVLLVGSPALGWMVQRVVTDRVRRRTPLGPGNADMILLRAVRPGAVVLFALVGALATVSLLPLEGGLRSALTRVLFALLIVWITFVGARVAADAIRTLTGRQARRLRSTSMFVNLARIGIIFLGVLFLLQNLGISVTPFLTALGIGGIAVALALQDTLSNFFAGLQILATRKVNTGDFVRLDSGEEGYVVDIDWRHTSVRQLPNSMILVPNAKLADSVITNFHYPTSEMSVLVDVGVSYDSDLDEVERVTVEVAGEVLRSVPGAVADFETFIRYHTLNDYRIDFTVVLRVSEITAQHLLRHEFLKRLHERYRQEGIEIPFPVQTVRVHDAREPSLSPR